MPGLTWENITPTKTDKNGYVLHLLKEGKYLTVSSREIFEKVFTTGKTFSTLKTKLTHNKKSWKFQLSWTNPFSIYLFSKAKITRFEKTSFELTVTKIFKIKLQYRKILAQVVDFVIYFFSFSQGETGYAGGPGILGRPVWRALLVEFR